MTTAGYWAALEAVDGDGVGVRELIELGEVVVHLLVLVGEHGEGLLGQGQGKSRVSARSRNPGPSRHSRTLARLPDAKASGQIAEPLGACQECAQHADERLGIDVPQQQFHWGRVAAADLF